MRTGLACHGSRLRGLGGSQMDMVHLVSMTVSSPIGANWFDWQKWHAKRPAWASPPHNLDRISGPPRLRRTRLVALSVANLQHTHTVALAHGRLTVLRSVALRCVRGGVAFVRPGPPAGNYGLAYGASLLVVACVCVHVELRGGQEGRGRGGLDLHFLQGLLK